MRGDAQRLADVLAAAAAIEAHLARGGLDDPLVARLAGGIGPDRR